MLTDTGVTIRKLYASISRDLKDWGNRKRLPPRGISHIHGYLQEAQDGYQHTEEMSQATLKLALDIKRVTQSRKEYR